MLVDQRGLFDSRYGIKYSKCVTLISRSSLSGNDLIWNKTDSLPPLFNETGLIQDLLIAFIGNRSCAFRCIQCEEIF